MNEQLATVIGMSIAYIASFVGLGLAWWAWSRRVEDGQGSAGGTDDPPPGSRGGTRSRDGGADVTGGSGPSDAPGPAGSGHHREDAP